jgi:hypothetical protein
MFGVISAIARLLADDGGHQSIAQGAGAWAP